MVENKKLTSRYVKDFTKNFIDNNEEDCFLAKSEEEILNLIKVELINDWDEEEVSSKEGDIKKVIGGKKLDFIKYFTNDFIDNNEEDCFLIKSKEEILNLIKEELIKKNWIENEVSQKNPVILRIINQKQFDFVISNLSDSLNNLSIKINTDDYDGIGFKKFTSSERKVNSNQTHIVIPTELSGLFPYLYPEEYLKKYALHENLKSYFSLEIPILISESNLSYLKGDENSHKSSKKYETTLTVRRSRGDGRDQFEMGHKSISGDIFNEFNNLLLKDYMLIIFKIKGKLKYEAYGIKPSDIDSLLKKFGNRFFYSKSVTVLPLNVFDINDEYKVKGGENILLYGVPGSGKSWTINNEYCDDESRMERVVFHPDYTYSDFIGQILPKLDEKKVFYEFSPGPFTSILKKAHDDPTRKYFLVIEEINRGNAPAIFGDVFQLLDRVSNEDGGLLLGTSEYGISNEYIADIVYDGDKKRKVRIPPNLSIIATMNTADQNVFTLDTAFQRRWNMRLIENNFNDAPQEFCNETILDTELTWKKFCTEINELILENNTFGNSSEDKRLGAYFVNLNDLKYDKNEENGDYLKNRNFPEKVLKYLWDDAFKLNRKKLFNIKEFNSLESIILEFNSKKYNERLNIFKPDVLEKLEIEIKTFESNSEKND